MTKDTQADSFISKTDLKKRKEKKYNLERVQYMTVCDFFCFHSSVGNYVSVGYCKCQQKGCLLIPLITTNIQNTGLGPAVTPTSNDWLFNTQSKTQAHLTY